MKRLKPSEKADELRAEKLREPIPPLWAGLPDGYPFWEKNNRFARKLWQRMVRRFYARRKP